MGLQNVPCAWGKDGKVLLNSNSKYKINIFLLNGNVSDFAKYNSKFTILSNSVVAVPESTHVY